MSKTLRPTTLFLCIAIAWTLHCDGQTIETGVLGDRMPWQTSYFIRDSGLDGPTVLVTGGIHGNEPAGARSADQIRHWPIVKGKLIVIPRVNVFGLEKEIRYLPGADKIHRDLNRNFPSPEIARRPRGKIASELWKFVLAQNIDWHFDLHEGYEFNISHQPKPGKAKSVGSTIIYDRSKGNQVMVDRMLASANATVGIPERKFVLLGRGPKKTSLASAVIDVLGRNAMILETTFKQQRIPVRTRQHRAMMDVALRHLQLIERPSSDVLTPKESERREHVFAAIYSDEGASERDEATVVRLLDASDEISVMHLGSKDLRKEILQQFDVLIFAGGSGAAQARAVGPSGAEAIRSFVNDGGGLVGISAGAYLCSAHYPWSLKLVDTSVYTGVREIEGVGPRSMHVRGGNTKVEIQLTDLGQRAFPTIPEYFDADFHNGPIVSAKGRQELRRFRVLAYFRSEQVLYPPQKGTMIHTPAIVIGDFGEGKVMSISPHLERSPGVEKMIENAVRHVARPHAVRN